MGWLNPLNWYGGQDPTIFLNFCLMIFVVAIVLVVTSPLIALLESQSWFASLKSRIRSKFRRISAALFLVGAIVLFMGILGEGAEKALVYIGLLTILLGYFSYRWSSSYEPSPEMGKQVFTLLYFLSVLIILYLNKEHIIKIMGFVVDK